MWPHGCIPALLFRGARGGAGGCTKCFAPVTTEPSPGPALRGGRGVDPFRTPQSMHVQFGRNYPSPLRPEGRVAGAVGSAWGRTGYVEAAGNHSLGRGGRAAGAGPGAGHATSGHGEPPIVQPLVTFYSTLSSFQSLALRRLESRLPATCMFTTQSRALSSRRRSHRKSSSPPLGVLLSKLLHFVIFLGISVHKH